MKMKQVIPSLETLNRHWNFLFSKGESCDGFKLQDGLHFVAPLVLLKSSEVMPD